MQSILLHISAKRRQSAPVAYIWRLYANLKGNIAKNESHGWYVHALRGGANRAGSQFIGPNFKGGRAPFRRCMFIRKRCKVSYLIKTKILVWERFQEFMLCKHELMDARKCVAEGKAVTSCALNFFRQIKANCAQEFMQYANCLDKSSTNASYKK